MERTAGELQTDRKSFVFQIAPAAAGVYLLALLSFLILKPAGLFERDGYYHARFANLLPSFGLSREFHWTQASTWRTQFCDKEFLFHVLMAPFATNTADPLSGVRYFSVLASAAIFVLLFFALRGQKTRWPVFFALLPLCMGGPFLMRAIMIRSHVLSISLLLIGMILLMKRKWKWLGALGFMYAWSYTIPFALVMTALPFTIGLWLIEKKFDWKLPAAAFAGVMAGLIIHPYSPLTLETFLTYVQVMRIGADTSVTALELGNEIYPLPWNDFLLQLPLYTLAFIAVWAGVWRLGKRCSSEALGAACAALFWYAMSLHYGRFLEYGVPLTALALGLCVRDLFRESILAASPALLAASAVICIGCHLQTVSQTYKVAMDTPPDRFQGAAAWMSENLEPGETVANVWWVEFPELYYDGYRQNYLWGLDPTYTLRWNPDIAAALEKMRIQRDIHPASLAKAFNARVLIMGHMTAMDFPIFNRTDWEPVYADPYAVIFALSGPHGPAPDIGARVRAKPLRFFSSRSIKLKSDE